MARKAWECMCGADSTVYSATAWWTDSDPSMAVVATTAKKAEWAIRKMMREEARRAWDDESYDRLYQAEDDIHWSGVHAFALSDLASKREMDEAIQALNDDGIWYPPTP